MPHPYDDPYDPQQLRRIRMFVYLVPVLGVIPAMWALAVRKGDSQSDPYGNRRERQAARLATTMGLGWLVGYVALAAGAHAADPAAMPLLIANSALTSGYFVVMLWLMLRLWQRKPLRLPGISDVSDRLP
ncbi:MAG: hypothetical protein SNJ81_05320 [Cyanobacteriota bacterium]